MTKVLVAGLVNIETTLRIEGFPIAYCPVRYPFNGVHSSVSGVGFNVARAMTTLGDEVRFLSMVGMDMAGELAIQEIVHGGISRSGVKSILDETPQSVILYDGDGRRQINVDLKNIQEAVYPEKAFERNLSGCELAVLCNVNFSRPMIRKVKDAGIWMATDVHAISSMEDPYNHDFMQYADILFMSHESLPCPPEAWARELQKRFGNALIVIGLGKDGALLADRDKGTIERFPALVTRPVVNTIGAGDALFSSFLHFFLMGEDAAVALQKAILFASWKIGEIGAAMGFLSGKPFQEKWQALTPAL